MKESLQTLWLTFVFISFCRIGLPQKNSAIKRLNRTVFDCDLNIDDEKWILHCDSQNFANDSFFFIVNLHGSLNLTLPVTYKGLLRSTSYPESNCHVCGDNLRDFVKFDQSAILTQCYKCKKYLKDLVLTLDKSSLKSVTILNTKKTNLVLNILSECSDAHDIIVSGNSTASVSYLPVPINNSINYLSLKGNDIKNISDGLFNNLYCMTSLDLSYNNIKSVDKNMFNGAPGIRTLDMSHNLIQNISDNALMNLRELEIIYLNNNNLDRVSEDLFSFNYLLSIIDISCNNFQYLPEKLFHNMPQLKNVSCISCGLRALDKDIFMNSFGLVWANFYNNSLENLHENVFNTLHFLEVVDLGNNNLSYLTDNMFSNHPYLMYLNFTKNQITYLNSKVYIGAANIRYLDFSENKITTMLKDDHIKKFSDLEVLCLQNNMIEAIEIGISIPVKIRKLDLSNNLIVKLNVRWKQLIYIEYLNLDNNLLTHIDLPPCIPSIKQTLTFFFRHNRISKVNIDSLLSDEIRVKTDRTMSGCFFNGLAKNFVDVTFNPIVCDCNLYPFYKYIREKSPRKYQLETIINANNITCSKPEVLCGQSLVSLADDLLSCPIGQMCPQPCFCGIRGKDNYIFVNCTSKSLYAVPESIPDKTMVLYFNKNELSSLESLNVDSWDNLVEIHLDYNVLTTLDGWKIPAYLRYLSIRGNKLKTLPVSFMHFVSNLTDFMLYFGDNDENCDCDRKSLRVFLIKNSDFIKDADNVLCNITSNGTSFLAPLHSVSVADLCPQVSNNLSFSQKKVIISLCVCFTFVISMLLFYYKQRHLILTFMYIHCEELCRFFYSEEQDEDKIFDAFVAYSSNDYELVLELLDKLENNPPFFHLCIHERNWLPGRFITENISDSVDHSKRTIIILSNAFISSPWFNVELRAAVAKMSQDKMNRIIVILAEKSVSLDNIDPELRYVVSKRTYLVWGERWFWEKLRYALPRKKYIKDDKLKDCELRGSISEETLIPNEISWNESSSG